MSEIGDSKTGGFARSLTLRTLAAVAILCGALNLKLAFDLDANRRTLADLEQRVAESRASVALELESLRVLTAGRLVLCMPAGRMTPPVCKALDALEALPPCGHLEPPAGDPTT